MAIPYTNLPGIPVGLRDQGLGVSAGPQGPRTLVLGVAGTGQSNYPYVTLSSSSAASEYGSTGTLTRGMYETRGAGAANVHLYRIGSTSAKLEHVGDSLGVGGYTVESLRRDDDAGGIYSIYYDDASDRLVVWNIQSGTIVYDNDSTDPIDTGEVIVSGSRAAGGGPDIAGPSAGMAMEDIVGAGHTGVAFTAGTDGSSPSRMELYQYLYKAYKALLGLEYDFIVPMDVYLDDKNIVDGDAFSASYLASIVTGGTFPTAAGADDILGKVYVEKYQGAYQFFWDLNGTGIADLYPNGVGAASSTTKTDGSSLSAADFHEVNFAYQLARFCHVVSVNHRFALGVVGVRPPDSLSLEDISTWIGELPTYTTRSDGSQYIYTTSHNGDGLLGNKFLAGSYAHRASAAYGGLVLTDSEFLDGTEQNDDNDWPIDIGRYISCNASYVRLFNGFDTSGRGYVTTAGPSYLAYVSTLDEQFAPTNKVMTGMRRVLDIGPRQVDDLAGVGYVYLFERPKGLTVSDSPTCARPQSDFRRLTTMRIVKRVVAAVRSVADPFIGNSFDAGRKQALELAIGQALDRLVVGGYIERHLFALTQTASQRVNGEADLELTIVPAWELRRINVTVALSAV